MLLLDFLYAGRDLREKVVENGQAICKSFTGTLYVLLYLVRIFARKGYTNSLCYTDDVLSFRGSWESPRLDGSG